MFISYSFRLYARWGMTALTMAAKKGVAWVSPTLRSESDMRFLYALSPVLAVAGYLGWRHFAAQVYVGDLPPFDLGVYGYTEALAYVAGLTPEAKAVYLGPLHRADLALMLALTVTLILPARRWFWAIPALLYLGFDQLENGLVAQFLTRGIHEVGEVATLGLFTGAKFGFLVLAVVVAIWGIWRRWRG
jgi:hypothetical protein